MKSPRVCMSAFPKHLNNHEILECHNKKVVLVHIFNCHCHLFYNKLPSLHSQYGCGGSYGGG